MNLVTRKMHLPRNWKGHYFHYSLSYVVSSSFQASGHLLGFKISFNWLGEVFLFNTAFNCLYSVFK